MPKLAPSFAAVRVTREPAPSPQQAAIVSACINSNDSLLVEAVAGSGKSTTLRIVCSAITRELPRVRILICAFNKAIVEEMRAKLGDIPGVNVATMHSIGFAALRRVHAKPKVDGNKNDTLMDQMQVPAWQRGFVAKLVSFMKQTGAGITYDMQDREMLYRIIAHHNLTLDQDEIYGGADDPVEACINTALDLLRASIEISSNLIDFDDMIWLPLYLNRIGQCPDAFFNKYDWVFIDEAQDTNPVRRLLAKLSLAPAGRVLAVGDTHQAIYGFTGADASAMTLIEEEFSARRLPLTFTYRCGKRIVERARTWVSHIEAGENNPDGSVAEMAEADFLQLPAVVLNPQSAVLCRNTAPLVSLAFHFIRRRVPCHVEGRDIANQLVGLTRKWKTVRTAGDLARKLEDWAENEIRKARAKRNTQREENVNDTVAVLNIFIDEVGENAPIYHVTRSINELFGDTEAGKPSPNLTLSTIHKAKGREWDCVYWYGPNKYQPSPYATQPWQRVQENNLMYVACTRAKHALVEVIVGGKNDG